MPRNQESVSFLIIFRIFFDSQYSANPTDKLIQFKMNSLFFVFELLFKIIFING